MIVVVGPGVHPAPGGTTAVLHYDDYENLLCQVRGTKELVLFPPEDLENLYYVGRRKGKLKYDFPGKWTRYCAYLLACVAAYRPSAIRAN